MTNLEYLLTGGFLGLGASASRPVAEAVQKSAKAIGLAALAIGAVWIYSKVKK